MQQLIGLLFVLISFVFFMASSVYAWVPAFPTINIPQIILPTSTNTPTPTKKFIIILPTMKIIPLATSTLTPTISPTLTPTVTNTISPTVSVMMTSTTEPTSTIENASSSPALSESSSSSITIAKPVSTDASFYSMRDVVLIGLVIVLFIIFIVQSMWPTIKIWIHEKTKE